MKEIQPSQLELFRQYLVDLQRLPEDGSADHKVYTRWQHNIELIQQIANAIIAYQQENDDSGVSLKVKFRINHRTRDEYMVFKDYISYFLSSISSYESYMSTQLLMNGLLEKNVQEMTGFEFKTLILSIYKRE